MAYKITFKKSVSRDLKKINESDLVEILNKIEEELSVNPDKFPMLKGKFAGLRKLRSGHYRVIFTILEMETVLILRIAHRKEVYRK